MPDLAEQPYVVARLVDASGSRAELRVHVRRTTGRAAGIAGAHQLADLAAVAGGCSPVETVLRYPVKIVREGIGAPGSNRFVVGVLIFATTDPAQYGIVEIPGIAAHLVDPADEAQLLLTAPALQTYINTLIAGNFCNPFGYQLTACIAGLFQIRQ